MTTKLEVAQLTREIETALELAIAAFAPNEVLDALAVVAGLLSGLNRLALDQSDTPLFVSTVQRGGLALIEWETGSASHAPPKA
ncbi:hypothetical protein BH11MYX1_BH11MYX1_07900 [soil metagenome]